jgi:release factor glutamine methyltransferase
VPDLEWAAGRLASARYPDPRRAARRLRDDLAERTGVADGNPPAWREAVERVVRGEPIPYVTGLAGFRRLTLGCDRRALIPRPETEGLVDLALRLAPTGRVLDLGTGSGCIALALADEGTWDDVTGVDASLEALALARENGARTGRAVRWLAGSWCGPVAGERFDVILTNPPYIATGEWERLDPSVRDWEPRQALDGGPDGLDAVRIVLAQARGVLGPGGWLFMEVDARRAAATASLARALDWDEVGIHHDVFGRARYLAARRGAER